MKKLTKREEEIMNYLWENGASFVKEIQNSFPEPKPHYNTISTIVRNLEEKDCINHESFGNTYRYYAAISKDEYGKLAIKNYVKNYFDNSYKTVVSMFIEEDGMNIDEIKEIIDNIKKRKNNE